MKIILVFITLLFVASDSFSQLWSSAIRIEKLAIEGYHATFSPDGTKVLVTARNFKGLKLYGLENGTEIMITDDYGAGYNPIYTSEEIVYHKKGAEGRLEVYDLSNSQKKQVSERAFRLTRRVANDAPDQRLEARASDNLHGIEIQKGSGALTEIQPLGSDEDYLSVSISPNRDRVLFRVSGLGSFVADLEGRILFELGNVEFPKWISNDEVLYAEVEDDGHQYLSSELYTIHLGSGRKISLTNDLDDIALYPSVSAARNKIICHTPQGHIYIIHRRSSQE